jgi:hypothetical protein
MMFLRLTDAGAVVWADSRATTVTSSPISFIGTPFWGALDFEVVYRGSPIDT